MRKRVTALFAALAVLFVGLGTRLLYLSQSGLQTVSTEQSSRVQRIAVSRGTIYDRYVQPLVNDSTCVMASIAPFAEVSQVIGEAVTATEKQEILARLSAGERVVTTLASWLPPTVGITQLSAPIRYGANALAQHVIGYVDGENHGVTGVEKGYEAILSSFEGEATVSYSIDALGHASTASEDVLTSTLADSTGGIALTLDAQIQSIAQSSSLSYLERGAVTIGDAASGEILASVSLPSYDQNDVAAALEDTASPLLDRTLINYNIGSVFKIITAAAALEHGISAQTEYTCTGAVTVDGITFHCHNPLGDGSVTMEQAMALSCNCYFIQLALDVGAEPIYAMAQRAGFSATLQPANGIETARALLPSTTDLGADAALANFCIGQGDLMASVYHLNSLLGAVVNDGVWTSPSLYKGTVDIQGTLTEEASSATKVTLFSKKTAALLRGMLERTVAQGTGVAATPLKGTAGGKTGTAETGWTLDGDEVVQSWFAGYYPAENAQYIITVLSENGGANGRPAAALFADICDALSEAGLVENAQVLY